MKVLRVFILLSLINFATNQTTAPLTPVTTATPPTPAAPPTPTGPPTPVTPTACNLKFDYINYYDTNTTTLRVGTFAVVGGEWKFLNENMGKVLDSGTLDHIESAKKHGWNSIDGVMSMNAENTVTPGGPVEHFVQMTKGDYFSQFFGKYDEGADFRHHIEGSLLWNPHIRDLLPYDAVAGASFRNSSGTLLQKYIVVKGNQILNMTFILGHPPKMIESSLSDFSMWSALADKGWSSLDSLGAANTDLSTEATIFFTAVKGSEYVMFDLQGDILQDLPSSSPMSAATGFIDWNAYNWKCIKPPTPAPIPAPASSHGYMTFASKIVVLTILLNLFL